MSESTIKLANELGYSITRKNTYYKVSNSNGEIIRNCLGKKRLYSFLYNKYKKRV